MLSCPLRALSGSSLPTHRRRNRPGAIICCEKIRTAVVKGMIEYKAWKSVKTIAKATGCGPGHDQRLPATRMHAYPLLLTPALRRSGRAPRPPPRSTSGGRGIVAGVFHPFLRPRAFRRWPRMPLRSAITAWRWLIYESSPRKRGPRGLGPHHDDAAPDRQHAIFGCFVQAVQRIYQLSAGRADRPAVREIPARNACMHSIRIAEDVRQLLVEREGPPRSPIPAPAVIGCSLPEQAFPTIRSAVTPRNRFTA